jgi:acetyl/propionyl-CoA carboxylase alpha subunit
MSMKFYTISPGTDRQRRVGIEALSDSRFRVLLDPGSAHAREVEVDSRRVGPGMLSVLNDGASYDVDVWSRGEELAFACCHLPVFEGEVVDDQTLLRRQARGGRNGGDSPNLTIPIAGKVIAINVGVGAMVALGQAVAVVEAMKMENEITAHRPGIVGEIALRVGDLVDPGAILLTIETGPQP